MKDIEKVGAIYKTTNYSMFKKLSGNRGITSAGLNKVKNSIAKNGYHPFPITVNEKMEVVEGQHRLAVAEELGLPILYIVDRGAGIEECKILNNYRSSWKIKDYISCEAENGNVDYKYIQSLFTAFEHKFQQDVIINAIRQTKSGESRKRINKESLTHGNYRCSKNEYENANKLLEELVPYRDCIIKKAKATVRYLFALEFILKYCNIDKARLYQVLNETHSLYNVANVTQAIEEIDKLYNFRLGSKNKVYLNHEYEVWMNTK